MKDDPMNRTKVRRGSVLPQSKLDEEDVKLVLELLSYREQLKQELKHLTNAKIADKFDVSVRCIDQISAGETWGHVEVGHVSPTSIR